MNVIPRTSSADHLLQNLAARTLELSEEELAAVASLDASILLMPLVKFISPTDPKWLSTLAVVEEQLTHDVLVDRYRNSEADDGLEGEDGSFSICSFWFVENLARSGRVDDARLLFDKMLSYAGPLGLFSEVISPAGEQLGNYPQVFTHLSLIGAAVHLDHIMD